MSNKVSYKSQDHLITSQAKAEERFMSEFNKQEYTVDAPYVVKNPYLVNPLCALVMFKTSNSVTPTVTVRGKRVKSEDLSHTYPANTTHFLPILGLYEDFANTVVISCPDGKRKEITIQTDKLPEDVCRCLNIRTSAEYLKDNFMFLSPAGKNLPTAYDYRGEIRWLLTENTMFDIKRMTNGNIITGSSRFCHMPYNSTGIIELNLMGKIYKEYRLPGNYHHDHFEMEDGNLLVLTQDFHRETVEDMCVLIDRETGKILKTWDYTTFLPQNVGGSGSQDAHDWFHNNAVWFEKKTHSLTLSGRHQDAIVNIDFDSGKLNWIIGDPNGWPKEMVDKYFFKPVGDLTKFDWQYEQHSCVVCPNGDIMAFDNGQYRSKIKENYILNKDNFSRGVRYRIDTKKMEIEQVWQYGKELGTAFFSPYICNVEYYDEGHYLIHSGGMCYKNGVVSDGLGAFMAGTDSNVELRSVTVEEKDSVVQYNMQTEGNFYRAEKLTLYHEGPNITLGPGKLLGKLDITPEFDTIPDAQVVDRQPDSWHHIVIEEDIDRMVFHGKFERGTLVMLCLEGDNGNHHYFINTAAVSYLAMCSGAYLEDDERDVKMNISKEGLVGKKNIRIIIDDLKYDLGVSIFC